MLFLISIITMTFLIFISIITILAFLVFKVVTLPIVILYHVFIVFPLSILELGLLSLFLYFIFIYAILGLIALVLGRGSRFVWSEIKAKIAFLKVAHLQRQLYIRRRKKRWLYALYYLFGDIRIIIPLFVVPNSILFTKFTLRRSFECSGELEEEHFIKFVNLRNRSLAKPGAYARALQVYRELSVPLDTETLFDIFSDIENLDKRDRHLIYRLARRYYKRMLRQMLWDLVTFEIPSFLKPIKQSLVPHLAFYLNFMYMFSFLLSKYVLDTFENFYKKTIYAGSIQPNYQIFDSRKNYDMEHRKMIIDEYDIKNFKANPKNDAGDVPSFILTKNKQNKNNNLIAFIFTWLYDMSYMIHSKKKLRKLFIFPIRYLKAQLSYQLHNSREIRMVRVDGRIDQFVFVVPKFKKMLPTFLYLFQFMFFLTFFLIGVISLIKSLCYRLWLYFIKISIFYKYDINFNKDLIYLNLSTEEKTDILEMIINNYLRFSNKTTIFFDYPSNFNLLNYIVILSNCLIVLIVLLGMVAFFTLLERKLLAAVQHRKGPNIAGFWGMLQPIADGVKLVFKQNVIPSSSNTFLFVLAPVFIFCLSFAAWSVIPFGLNLQITTLDFDILFLLAVSSLSVYGIILGGWSSNSKYAFLGSLRSAGQMLSYEIALGLSILPVVLVTGGFNLNFIVTRQTIVGWNLFGLFPAFIIFVISMLVETNRHPFDLPEAEAELVAGYNVEYGGFFFAFYFLAEYASMILMSFLGSLLFLGGWSTGILTDGILANLPLNLRGYFLAFMEISVLMLKNSMFFYFFVLVRAFLPRTRPDQLMSFGWKVLLPISFAYVIFILGVIQAFDCGPAPFVEDSFALIV